MIYGMATRLRSARCAAAGLEAGRPPKEVEASLPMAPYPSKLLVRAVGGTSPAELSEAIGAIADSSGGRAAAPTTTSGWR